MPTSTSSRIGATRRTWQSCSPSLDTANDRETFVASEGARSILEDPIRGLHIDVFYDRLEFCHTIPLVDRLEADAPTIPLAELVLSKLQIVKINEKDVIDLILLLLDHPVGSGRSGHHRR